MRTTYEIREADFGWFITKNGETLSPYKRAREDAEQNRPAEITTFADGMQEKEELP